MAVCFRGYCDRAVTHSSAELVVRKIPSLKNLADCTVSKKVRPTFQDPTNFGRSTDCSIKISWVALFSIAGREHQSFIFPKRTRSEAFFCL